MNRWIPAVALLLVFLVSCGEKKEDSSTAYFSVPDFVRSQIKGIDSTAHRFTRIESRGEAYDTAEIDKKQFHQYAEEFLRIPDIASPSLKKKYKEENSYDETLKNVLLTYSPTEPDAEVQRQVVMLVPDELGNTQVSTLQVDWIENEGKEAATRYLIWHVGHRFQVVTKSTAANGQESVHTLIVKWE